MAVAVGCHESPRAGVADGLTILRSLPARRPVLAEPVAVGFDAKDDRWVPRFVTKAGAEVELPANATGAFGVRDPESGLGIEVALEGARDAEATLSDGYVVYRGARSRADLLHRVTLDGTEDFLVFASAPSEPVITYRVALDAAVAGLRLVHNAVEFLDRAGTPRIRMAPPYLVDAGGTRRSAVVTVEGCAVDTSPVAPWGRLPVRPGAATCAVHLAWSRDLRYPAALDPAWTVTGNMTVGHDNHTASRLANGRVLVVGTGTGSDATIAELFDPVTSTWSVTGALAQGRFDHAATVLKDGRVLVVGGSGSGGPGGGSYLDNAETYDPASGVWSPAGTLATPRWHASATTLASGFVLVAGGTVYDDVPTSELYNPAGTWALVSGAPMGGRRFDHTASLLTDGRVLVAGGFNPFGNELATAEIYDPATGGWAATGSMTGARGAHTADTLPGGRVLVAGGGTAAGVGEELFDPAAGSWLMTGKLAFGRTHHVSALLPNGHVLVAGGATFNAAMNTAAERYDPTTGTWSPAGTLAQGRPSATATALATGGVLVAGGAGVGNVGTTAELFALDANGTPCTAAAACASGHCVDGVCCATACGGGVPDDCQACNIAGSVGQCTNRPANTSCKGNANATECTEPSTCDGAGACRTANKPDGTSCTGGACERGVCKPAAPSVGPADAGLAGPSGGPTIAEDECSCRILGGSAHGERAWTALLVLVALGLRRRRLARGQ